MIYIATGCLGFLVIYLFDIVSLKRLSGLKPFTWILGSSLVAYSLVMVCLDTDKLPLPLWSTWLGWVLLTISLALMIYSLFINLPFRRTYIATGVGDKLVTTGFYALVRHPGVHCFSLLMLSLIPVSRSSLLLIAAPVLILLDILLVVVQDKFLFGRMFAGYDSYQQVTPMLVPNRRSLNAFINSLRKAELKILSIKEEKKMATLGELLKQGRYEELWQRCCGFIDLSLEDFMKIQKRLLLEQIELLKNCELGRYIFNGADPHTVEEFRKQVPITTYADYAPYLLKRRKDILPEKPLVWVRTSGRSGEYPAKWVPLTNRQYEALGPIFLAVILFGSCKKKGEVTLREHDKYLYALAPSPYISGVSGRRVDDESILDFLPPLDEAEKMEFAQRIEQGFKLALFEGMDIFGGISSVLVAIGERFSQGNGNISIKPFLRKPRVLLRLVKGLVKSKLALRPMLPRDVWSLKGVMAGGTDTLVFREKIREMWGRYPLDAYGCSESSIIATQTWDYQGMTFIPHINLLEFIPEKDSLKSKEDPSYQPKILLLDEVSAGENYEIVITNFLGGALVRYRVGDMIKITSLRNEQLNIDIPQMVFYSRVDGLIDIAGFTRLTEGIIWQAIERSGIAYQDWAVRKEIKDKPVLHLYLELKQDGVTAEQVATSVHEQLKKLDKDYANVESLLGLMPLEITLLPAKAFQAYIQRQQAAGADLAHLKIPHINPSDSMLNFLITSPREVPVASQ